MDSFIAWGYPELFIAAFLAATILPLSSEIVLGGLLLAGLNPVGLVGVATIGNVLGSLTNYLLGFKGGEWLIQKVLKISNKELEKSRAFYNRYGVLSLLLAWVPVIGDPLTVVAGLARTKIWIFILLVFVGICARYVCISYVVLKYN